MNKKPAKSSKNKSSKPTSASASDIENEAKVLFQKICGKWYAFSVVNNEAFMTEVNEDLIKKTNNKSNA
jgi:hypothetical protein